MKKRKSAAARSQRYADRLWAQGDRWGCQYIEQGIEAKRIAVLNRSPPEAKEATTARHQTRPLVNGHRVKVSRR